MNKRVIDTKVFKVLSYVFILWLVGLVSPYRNERDVKFHIGQGIILTIFIVIFTSIIFLVNNLFINKIFVVKVLTGLGHSGKYLVNSTGLLINTILNSLIFVVYLIYAIIGMANVMRGKDKFLPLIGRFSFINKIL